MKIMLATLALPASASAQTAPAAATAQNDPARLASLIAAEAWMTKLVHRSKRGRQPSLEKLMH